MNWTGVYMVDDQEQVILAFPSSAQVLLELSFSEVLSVTAT